MLLGFTGFTLSSPEAWAQAGNTAAGSTPVSFTVTTETPGFKLHGPFEDGFPESVTAFLLEYTPPNPGAEPPDHADIRVTVKPGEGWTLDMPAADEQPVEIEVGRGKFGDNVVWKVWRPMPGNPRAEEVKTGIVRVAWPWAEFVVSEFKGKVLPVQVPPAEDDPDNSIRPNAGVQLTCNVRIRVVPAGLPKYLKDAESRFWTPGWIQNIRSMRRVASYPNKIVWATWDTNEKESMPILDTVTPRNPHLDFRWYSQRGVFSPEIFDMDGKVMESVGLYDTPGMELAWLINPVDPDNREASRLQNFIHNDEFRSWIVAMRKENDDAVIEWLGWADWIVDYELEIVDLFHINRKKDDTRFGRLQRGKGALEPDLTLKVINDIAKIVVEDK